MAHATAIAERSSDLVFALSGQFPDLQPTDIEVFEEPDAEQRKANLATNVALMKWPRE